MRVFLLGLIPKRNSLKDFNLLTKEEVFMSEEEIQDQMERDMDCYIPLMEKFLGINDSIRQEEEGDS